MTVGQLIDGRWTEARDEAVSTNPAHPAEELGRHAVATQEEVEAAFDAARRAFRGWQRTSALERGRILRRAAALLSERVEELAVLLTREEGKTLREARGEVGRAVEIFYYHASQAWAPTGETFASSTPYELIRTERLPLGVVAVITPWNFPIAIPAWKLAPALVYGNTVVWKPASPTPLLAVELARTLVAAGLPDGVLNLVLGPARVGSALVDHPDVDGITFTGSTEVGKAIWRGATPRGVKVQLELGGHNAALVFPDADLEKAARDIVGGAMLSTGQKCTATRRVIVHRSVHDPLVERIRELTRGLRVGDGLADGVDIGPLISRTALEDVAGELRRAAAEGGEIVVGGDVLDAPDLDGGYFVAPTVFDGVTPSMRLAQEEVFGPVTAVIEVGDEDEAIDVANSTRYGLSASVFTADERRVRRIVAEVEVGMIHVNHGTAGAAGAEVHVPFGGTRDSAGQGAKEQGQAARDFFTELKVVYDEPGGRT